MSKKPVLAAFALLLMARSAEAEDLKLPSVTAPEPRVIKEQGASPLHYRKSSSIALPTFRTGFGIQARIPTENIEAKIAFTLDAYFGGTFRFGRGASTGLLTEAGYSYVGFSEHLASLGLGILHGIGPAPTRTRDKPALGRYRLGLVPHALVGRAYDKFAVGARTSLLFGYWIYGGEIAHQMLFVGPRTYHEIHFVLGSLLPLGEQE